MRYIGVCCYLIVSTELHPSWTRGQCIRSSYTYWVGKFRNQFWIHTWCKGLACASALVRSCSAAVAGGGGNPSAASTRASSSARTSPGLKFTTIMRVLLLNSTTGLSADICREPFLAWACQLAIEVIVVNDLHLRLYFYLVYAYCHLTFYTSPIEDLLFLQKHDHR